MVANSPIAMMEERQSRRQAKAQPRYRGGISDQVVERAYSFHVDMRVPPGGLGSRLDAMYDFHTQQNVTVRRGVGRREGDCEIIRWCFVDSEIAMKFGITFSDFVI